MLLFVTSAKVDNADRKQWEEAVQKDHCLGLHIIEREEIITLMMPENASLRASFLHRDFGVEPQVAHLHATNGSFAPKWHQVERFGRSNDANLSARAGFERCGQMALSSKNGSAAPSRTSHSLTPAN